MDNGSESGVPPKPLPGKQIKNFFIQSFKFHINCVNIKSIVLYVCVTN